MDPLVRVLAEDARREWPEVLAVLDLLVEDCPHRRVARVGEERAVAQRSGTPLHPSLEPADDGACTKQPGDRPVEVARALDGPRHAAQGTAHLLAGARRANIGSPL